MGARLVIHVHHAILGVLFAIFSLSGASYTEGWSLYAVFVVTCSLGQIDHAIPGMQFAVIHPLRTSDAE